MEIKDIDTDEFKKPLIHLCSKALMTNVKCFVELFPEIEKRMSNYPNFKEDVKDHAKEQQKQMHSQSNKDKEKDDVA